MNRQEPGTSPTTRPENGRNIPGDGGQRFEAEPERYEGESIPGLFRKLGADVSTLFRQEVALARSEMTDAVTDVRSGITSIATGGAVTYAGILFLLGGVMLLLTEWMSLMAAAFTVGGVVTVIGLIMLMAGKKKMSAESMKPDRTVDSLKRDAEFARRKVQ